MTEFAHLTTTELLAIAAPDNANVQAMRTQAMAARRYALELAEAIAMLTNLSEKVGTFTSGKFATGFVGRLTDVGAGLGINSEDIRLQSVVVDDIANEAESVYTDLSRYEAERQRDPGDLSRREASLVDDTSHQVARERMQQASDYYLERVNQLDKSRDAGPELQSAAPVTTTAVSTSPPAPAVPGPGGGGLALTPPVTGPASPGAPMRSTVPLARPTPMTPRTPGLPNTGTRMPSPGMGRMSGTGTGRVPTPGMGRGAGQMGRSPLDSGTAASVPRPPGRTVPQVIGGRDSVGALQRPGVRAVRSVHPPVIGSRSSARTVDERQGNWRPSARTARGFTEAVLGREPGRVVKVSSFTRTPVVKADAEGLTRSVITAKPEPKATPRPETPVRPDDPWAIGATTVPSVIGARRAQPAAIHDPGPVRFARTGSGRKVPALAKVRSAPVQTGKLIERLRRVQVRAVTGDGTVGARLNGSGELSLDFERVGTDMAALSGAIRAAMVAALRGRDQATARIIGTAVETPAGHDDPLAVVDVSARSRLGYVQIRWRGRSGVTVDIEPRAASRLTTGQLLSEVNSAVGPVLRRHREHLADINRRNASGPAGG